MLVLNLVAGCVHADALPGFTKSPYFDEQVREIKTDVDVRMLINAPAVEKFDSKKPTQLIFYTTPAGNTLEQTMGCQYTAGMDWHFDIQHIAAQTRRLREVDESKNIVVVCIEPTPRSWPLWKKNHPDHEKLVHKFVDDVAAMIPGKPLSLVLSGHSAGGSFMFSYINGSEKSDPRVERIAFLDANYSYSDEEHHGEKFLAWLNANPNAHLVVLAYDDRKIELNGKRVVSDTGGTYRASHRMIDFFNTHGASLAPSRAGDFESFTSADKRIFLTIHTNPQNKILHTLLVGEMNGFLHAMTFDTPLQEKWGKFNSGSRAYSKWIQPAEKTSTTQPATSTSGKIPPRPANATGGRALMKQLAAIGPAEREETIIKEIVAGNFPQFLRNLKTITLKSGDHTAEVQVMPDYLALGSDEDFVRIPMLPGSAQKIADALGCSLTTRKLCDDIYKAADVKLAPQPMTEKREAVETFLQHHEMIEQQRGNKPPGALIAGIKKDIVISNRLKEKPHKVAIYGWHQPNGKAIQPLYVGHGDFYVDYSHGVRLVNKTIKVDGKEMAIEDVLKNPDLAPLVSDEGATDPPRYTN